MSLLHANCLECSQASPTYRIHRVLTAATSHHRNSFARVEPIDPAVFLLTNEFWVSYYILDKIFDKKFIFTPGSFDPAHLRMIPELGLEGILHT